MSINYMQFHIGDFLGKTVGMDASETGAYMMLLCAHYRSGIQGLQDDDDFLSRVAKVGKKAWLKMKPRVLQDFSLRNGFFISEEVVSNIIKIKEKSNAGKANSLKRWDTDDANASIRQSDGNADLMQTQCYPITNNQEPIKKDIPNGISKEKNPKKEISKPDDVDDETWADFITLRKAKKAPITATAIKILRKEADKAGIPLQRAIEVSIQRGWTGFEADWMNKVNINGHTNGNGNTNGNAQKTAQPQLPRIPIEDWSELANPVQYRS